MGCRIDYGMREGVLRAVVSGKSSLGHAGWVARNIAEQAAGAAAERLLIDLRRLHDRIGTLRALLAEGDGPAKGVERIAVVDLSENDRYYVFSEAAARSRGCELRRFDDFSSAMSWLRGGRD
jgi:hypothetical protein